MGRPLHNSAADYGQLNVARLRSTPLWGFYNL
jgi:hypothetical protein